MNGSCRIQLALKMENARALLSKIYRELKIMSTVIKLKYNMQEIKGWIVALTAESNVEEIEYHDCLIFVNYLYIIVKL